MKTSLKVIFSALALGVLASPSFLRAQDDKTPPAEAPKNGDKGGKGGRGGRGQMNADALTDRLDKEVTLTAEQKPKVHAIYAKELTDVQALPRDPESRSKGQEIRTAANKEIRALLTDDQAKKFDEMTARAEKQFGGKGARKKGN